MEQSVGFPPAVPVTNIAPVPGHPPGLPPVLPPPGGAMSNEEKVFGVGFKRDEQGNPIERGHGAIGHETPQHLAARDRTRKLLEAQAESDPGALRKILMEIARPPEDMTPAERAKAEAEKAEAEKREDEQNGKIKELAQQVADQAMKLDAILAALAKPDAGKQPEF